jgi:hypothetical protein
MILDGLLAVALIMAWTCVIWFYGRAEYREPRFSGLLLLTAICAALTFLPWVGWLLALVLHYVVLVRAFDFPKPAARLMTVSLLVLYGAIWTLFWFAGA